MQLLDDVQKTLSKKILSNAESERLNRLDLVVAAEDWKPSIEALFHENLLSFTVLKAIVGRRDNLKIKITAELSSRLRSEHVSVSALIDKNDALGSLTSIWLYSDWFEHELNKKFHEIFPLVSKSNPFIGDQVEYAN